MFHKIKKVETLEKQILKVEFKNNQTKYYDMSKIINNNKEYEILKNNVIFNIARVDRGGYGIIWNEELDISGEELYVNGVDNI